MKSIKKLMLALLAVTAVTITTNAADAGKSPNGFFSPQCTYGVDMLTHWDGWNLNFSQNWGRHAKEWDDLITNGMCPMAPESGDILVLDAWEGNEYGHVAWVLNSWDDGWRLVVHTNWRAGTELFEHGGAIFRYSWLWDSGAGWVYCWDNKKWFPLETYIARP